MRADARDLPDVPRRLQHTVDLAIATPPARLNPTPPARRPRTTEDLIWLLHDDLVLMLEGCAPLLRPGGAVAVVTRLLPRRGELLDPTFAVTRTAEWTRLELIERAAALWVPIRDGHTRPRPARRRANRRHRATPPPVVHDDVLVYRVPTRWQRWLRE
jgi:hypothetical protein